MARSEGIQITGLRQVVRDLEKLGVSVEDLKAAFGEISSQVVQEAGRIVPVRSGRLAASIRPAKTKNKAVVRAGTAGAPYAGAINYGWPSRGIEATEFLTKPANSHEAEFARMIDRNLQDLIRRYGLT